VTELKKVLVTGGSGFLGAWVIRRLLAAGLQVRVFDIHGRRDTVAAINGVVADALDWRVADICDASAVRAAMEGCEAVVHLAGLLTSACSADPVRGAAVNLMGSLHVFEAARQLGVKRIAYASSAGVYGPDHVRHPWPATHYGAYKLAVEGVARACWAEHGLASTGFRPYVIYGPGRDSGISAGPSLACRAAVRGEPCTIAYTGASGLVFVDDVAQGFELAVREPLPGAQVLNLVGEVADMQAVIAEVKRHVPDARIDAQGPPLTISPDMPEDGVASRWPQGQHTTLQQGIAATVDFYRAQQRAAGVGV